MFERKKSPPQKRIDSLIGAGTTVDGDVTFSGGLRIDGVVQGKVATVDNQPATLVLASRRGSKVKSTFHIWLSMGQLPAR